MSIKMKPNQKQINELFNIKQKPHYLNWINILVHKYILIYHLSYSSTTLNSYRRYLK